MPKKIIFCPSILGRLGSRVSDSRKLAALHGVLRRFFPDVARVAAALYDAKTGTAATFLSHGDRPTPLAAYEARLDEAPSLRRVFRSRRIRVVNDMDVFAKGSREHTKAIRDGGFKSGAAFPILVEGRVDGFVFMNSRRKNAFAPESLPLLEVFARIAADVATARLNSTKMLRASLRTASEMVHYRDLETGNHLDRMARYSRVIAQELSRSGRRGFDDERIQLIEDYAPLHDVGKIGIPDRVLLKPGPLTKPERRLMKTHTTKGLRIVDSILRNFGETSLARANALRDIAEHHHEAMDGSGYPDHLRGGKISIEARIVAVADVFDALTSARPYKRAWTTDRAFDTLKKLGRTKLDRVCVRALIKRRREVESIRRRFPSPGTPARPASAPGARGAVPIRKAQKA
jgi:HD-GYP domain-containing protein (c-di-GMP phosphodiesterase class II)